MSLRLFRPVWLATAALLLVPSAASSAWTQTTPDTAGVLQAVDCSSPNSCIAVGYAPSGQPIPPFGGVRPLAERWDGTRWEVLPTPDLPGGGGGELRGVSCPWAQLCFAVGSSGGKPLVEVWDGTRWSIQPTPDLPAGQLNAISCSGLLACTAVGSTQGATLAERRDAGGWHIQPTPNGPNPGFSELRDVSCPLKRTCTAVGGYGLGGSPLVTRWYGQVNAWGLQSVPKPAGASSAPLEGVSCPVAPVCVAVGSSSVLGGPVTLMAERRIGANWSLLPTPPLPPPVGDGLSRLAAVSCPTLALCRAVGFADSSVPAIAERYDGTNWQLEPIPLSAPYVPLMEDVSCPSRFFCMAVGGWSFRSAAGTLSAKWTP